MSDDFFYQKKIRDEARKRNQELYKANSKRQLIYNIEKKFKTTMIGALSRFEEIFGYLWGHGKENLTQTEKEFKRLWERARTEILDNGNNQLRTAIDEINHYTVEFQKYKTDFLIKKEYDNG
jgi:hypothetical protein